MAIGHWGVPFLPRFSIPETMGKALSYEAQLHWFLENWNTVAEYADTLEQYTCTAEATWHDATDDENVTVTDRSGDPAHGDFLFDFPIYTQAQADMENVRGTLAVGHGGTGATTASAARANLGITYGNLGIVPVMYGGTGANNAAQACANMDAYSLKHAYGEMPSGADFNSYTTPGVYFAQYFNNYAHSPFTTGGSFYATLIVEEVRTNVLKQTVKCYRATDGVGYEFVRQYANNEWGAWFCVSGVDAIIAEGTTDGWNWRKWANGFAECFARISTTTKQTSDWTTLGNSWYTTIMNVKNFPFMFSAPPSIVVGVDSNVTVAAETTGNHNTTLMGSVQALRFSAPTSEQTVGGSVYVFGRWK